MDVGVGLVVGGFDEDVGYGFEDVGCVGGCGLFDLFFGGGCD